MRPTSRVSIPSLALALAACASSPATLVTLPAPPPPEANRALAQSSGTSVLLRPVVLPGYLDNYPVVTGRTGSTLIVSKDTEWAEPFRDAVARVLRDALSRRLGASRVLIAGDGRIPDADLSTEFLALDPQQSTLRLDAKSDFLLHCGAPAEPCGPHGPGGPDRRYDSGGCRGRDGGSLGTLGRCACHAGRMRGRRAREMTPFAAKRSGHEPT